MQLLTLSSGPMRVEIAPDTGGAIFAWHHGATGLLRADVSGTDGGIPARQLASFPLIPFSNRIAHGQFTFDGVTYTLPRDAKEARHAMHGNALYAAWDVAESDVSHAVLRLAYSPEREDMPFFPFAYEAEQRYEVTDTSLRIGLSLRNTDTRRFPAGFGHHLYFPRRGKTLVKFEAGQMWENGEDGLPSSTTAQFQASLAEGRALDSTSFDNCFENWQGQALLSFPQEGHTLSVKASPAFGHCVLFTPPGKPFFAFEPVTHLNDAVNRMTETNRHGLVILEPGEVLEGEVTITYKKSYENSLWHVSKA
ncbi:MAG: aldose 1-epimerase [Rhodospirillales bacterium]|nr:aldose 1-epimerase [Rhodospirillales bacterium]